MGEPVTKGDQYAPKATDRLLPAASAEVLDGNADQLLRVVASLLKGYGSLPAELIDGLLTPSGFAAKLDVLQAAPIAIGDGGDR